MEEIRKEKKRIAYLVWLMISSVLIWGSYFGYRYTALPSLIPVSWVENISAFMQPQMNPFEEATSTDEWDDMFENMEADAGADGISETNGDGANTSAGETAAGDIAADSQADGTAAGDGAGGAEGGNGGAAAGPDADGTDDHDGDEKKEEEIVPAVTEFIEYEPVAVKSRFYHDVGLTALTTAADFQTVDDSYFADACWIGDSRTMGLMDYSGWSESADFFCDNGYCIYGWQKGKKITNQRLGKKGNLADFLSEKQYGKVYIMLGINDCGYGTTESFQEGYRQFLDMIRERQPNAIFYLVANQHISKKAEAKSDKAVYTNLNINAKNVAIAQLADGLNSFYLDYNDLFTDENGVLKDNISFDGFHMYASQYPIWKEFFLTHAVVRDFGV